MIGKLKELLGLASPGGQQGPDPDEKLRTALAALLVEMARADFDQTDAEDQEIAKLLAQHFRVSEAEARALLSRAQIELDDAVCLHDFTRTLHQELEPQQKQQIIAMLWQVALADDKLDKYEEYLVRKIADLLYISPSDVIRLKHEVLKS